MNITLSDFISMDHMERKGTRQGSLRVRRGDDLPTDRKSTRLNSSHANISYAVFCLKKKQNTYQQAEVIHRTQELSEVIGSKVA